MIQYKENQKYRWDSGLRKLDLPLKALRQLSQNVWPKILTPYFFTVTSTNCENIFKIVCIVSEKIGKQIPQFAILFFASIRSCLQFHWNRKYFSSAALRLRGRLLLDWLILLLFLLQSVYCSKYSTKITNFSMFNLILPFLHPLHFRIYFKVMLVKQKKTLRKP